MRDFYEVRIPFTPHAKQSVRLSSGNWYNPSARGMLEVREYVCKDLALSEIPLFDGPLLVVMHFRIPIPKFTRGAPRRAMADLPHFRKPDIDNLEKFMNDALKGVIWRDDSQISWSLRSKTNVDHHQGSTLIYVCPLEKAVTDPAFLGETLCDNLDLSDSYAKTVN